MNERLQFVDHLFVLLGDAIPGGFQSKHRTVDERGHNLQNAVEISQVSTNISDGA